MRAQDIEKQKQQLQAQLQRARSELDTLREQHEISQRRLQEAMNDIQRLRDSTHSSAAAARVPLHSRFPLRNRSRSQSRSRSASPLHTQQQQSQPSSMDAPHTPVRDQTAHSRRQQRRETAEQSEVQASPGTKVQIKRTGSIHIDVASALPATAPNTSMSSQQSASHQPTHTYHFTTAAGNDVTVEGVTPERQRRRPSTARAAAVALIGSDSDSNSDRSADSITGALLDAVSVESDAQSQEERDSAQQASVGGQYEASPGAQRLAERFQRVRATFNSLRDELSRS